MGTVLWVIAIILAVAFLGAGVMKLVQPKEKLVASGMGWAEGYSAGAVKAIGAIVTHARRGETQPVIINVVLLILAAVVAWGRFGPYSF
ncbi:DoxX family protein [Couchioplanes caeruleus]|uniref:DoxX family protein n=1 Tax=Couchioplanes caeruleus TaxID=56438 RepID=UPI0020C17C45|nr:DoxX family protein [Couchioplanes caeruleus]UQU63756.1 DoxX family protein [Couchioplanes caeruleus]